MLDEIPGQEVAPIPAPSSDALSIDFSLLRSDSHSSLDELFEFETFPELVLELIRNLIMLPRADEQVPIVASYLSLPSALCTKIPVLFSHGPSGSGKSVIASIATAIYASPKLGAATTMAALRNQIQSGKTVDDREVHYCLAWDDINPQMLSANSAVIFSLIKNGIERGAKLTIAGGEPGENIEFDIFSPKITSSIHPIYSLPEFREIIRRVVVIQHKPVSQWLASDYSQFYEGRTSDDLIDSDDIKLKEARKLFNAYWDVDKLYEFVAVKSKLKNIKKVRCPRPLWNISKDLIATGTVCGYWPDMHAAIAAIENYWAWHAENVESQSTNLSKILKRFISEQSAQIEKQNELARQYNQLHLVRAIEIDPQQLKTYFEAALRKGEIEPGTRLAQLNEAMLSLGYKLNQNAQGKSAWMQITSG